MYARTGLKLKYKVRGENSINTNVNGWIKCVGESPWLHSRAITKDETFPFGIPHTYRRKRHLKTAIGIPLKHFMTAKLCHPPTISEGFRPSLVLDGNYRI
jgi:hypothetical protein